MLNAISPVDGRYRSKVDNLAQYFSEFALIKYRLFVEVQYFITLTKSSLPQLPPLNQLQINELSRFVNDFDLEEAEKVKAIERETNHDVKAVEYYLKQHLEVMDLGRYKEFVHFCLTSQDINNTAIPLSLKHAVEKEYLPTINELIHEITVRARSWRAVPMLARTHGQPASPTTLGKELLVFAKRLHVQVEQLQRIPFSAKFGGATGNLNAHWVAYPEVDWEAFANHFVDDVLGLQRSSPTTQIEHYDNLAAGFQAMKRINTILIDLCRDVWAYISMEYFGQKVVAKEVGSSTMPHKINPIDFENAEGNLGMANAVFIHLADKLPVSRLQRDLTDSTVLRNIGVPIAHSLIAFRAIRKGIDKLLLNKQKLEHDLEKHWIVVAEGIQSVLRREGFENPYEALKALTRKYEKVTKKEIHAFIDDLEISAELKAELKQITPFNYVGKNKGF